MMQIKCEMCGSSDMVKEDSLYVCKHCGMKYSPEEAKKMMVEIEGAVKIDDTEELANLHVLARRALDANSIDNARKYYDMILIKEPTNWEAAFYSLVFNATNCKVGELPYACNQISSGIPQVVDLVKNVVVYQDKKRAYEEIANRLVREITIMESSVTNCSGDIIDDTKVGACLTLYAFALALRNSFPNKEFLDIEMICIQKGIIINRSIRYKGQMRQIYTNWLEYIKQNDADYFQELIKMDKMEEKELKKSEISTTLGYIFGIAIFIVIVGLIISGLGNFFNW